MREAKGHIPFLSELTAQGKEQFKCNVAERQKKGIRERLGKFGYRPSIQLLENDSFFVGVIMVL